MAELSEWMKVMLEEVERKRVESTRAREEERQPASEAATASVPDRPTA